MKIDDSRLLLTSALSAALLGAGLGTSPALGQAKVERLAIVDRSIEHHGGELFRAVDVALRVSSRSGSFNVVSSVLGNLFEYRVKREQDGQRVEHFQANDLIEVRVDGELQPLDDDAAQRARDYVSARLYFCLLPSRLNDPNTFKQDLGRDNWEGRELHKVKVTFTPGSSTAADDEYLYWFDPKSGRLEQFAYSFATGGGGLRFRKLFNYRRIDGLLFADQENHAVDGRGLAVDQITPEYVKAKMSLLSTVVFSKIKVKQIKVLVTTASTPD